MTEKKAPVARVSMLVHAPREAVLRALVEPAWLTRFWLASSSGPLEMGVAVHWEFLVPGAAVETTLTRRDPERGLSWRWSDGTTVDVDLEDVDAATAVTLVNAGFDGTPEEQLQHALDATEGFAIVLCDMKTLLESNESAGLTRSKARLIELRAGK
jgi:uncharacterized protein YndB with AHSA1/START domain